MLPENQGNMLSNVSSVHRYAMRSAKAGLFISTQDHRSIGYRIPSEWQSLAGDLQGMSSLTGFKKKSKASFIAQYKSFKCTGFKKKSKASFIAHYKSFKCTQINCFICSSRAESEGRNAALDV